MLRVKPPELILRCEKPLSETRGSISHRETIRGRSCDRNPTAAWVSGCFSSSGWPQEEDGAEIGSTVGDLSVGATIHALRNVKGASTIAVDQQVLSGNVENYRSNLLLHMIASGLHNSSFDVNKVSGWAASITEQQMIMKELSGGSPGAEADIIALAGESIRFLTLPLS